MRMFSCNNRLLITGTPLQNNLHELFGWEGKLLITGLFDGTHSFEIEDNGNGISKKLIHKIFDPFFTTKDVGQGTGLGLSISHGIVESHGGSIHVESQLNEGTTFTLNFPIPQQHVAELDQVVNG